VSAIIGLLAVVKALVMAATASRHIQLAKALPPRLQTFLARYPPPSILKHDPITGELPKTGYQQDTPNPFLYVKNQTTGKWRDPIYSMRRQSELVKLAREHGVEELLPTTVKGTEERLRKRVEFGLRVRGTGVGQKVKGHRTERRLAAKYATLPHLFAVLVMLTTLQDGCKKGGYVGYGQFDQTMEAGKLTYTKPERAFRMLTKCVVREEELPEGQVVSRVSRALVCGLLLNVSLCTITRKHG
jgi:large subunit ribosomal protein L25